VLLAVMAGLLMPPAQYDYEPTRPYVIHYAAPERIAEQCRGLDLMVAKLRNPKARALGCTDLATLEVWIDSSLTFDEQAKVLRHERAHVNGWRH
jgi:hypothetical protein